MKKPQSMSRKELGDAHEERTAKALQGRTQRGSGAVKVAMMRGDVIASPFMIECKSTANNYINILYDVWDDVKKKAKETPYKPAYAISTIDCYGNFYDLVGLKQEYFTPKLLKSIAPNGMLFMNEVNKTSKTPYVESCVKSFRYLKVHFTKSDETLLFVPLNRLALEFKTLVKGL